MECPGESVILPLGHKERHQSCPLSATNTQKILARERLERDIEKWKRNAHTIQELPLRGRQGRNNGRWEESEGRQRLREAASLPCPASRPGIQAEAAGSLQSWWRRGVLLSSSLQVLKGIRWQWPKKVRCAIDPGAPSQKSSTPEPTYPKASQQPEWETGKSGAETASWPRVYPSPSVMERRGYRGTQTRRPLDHPFPCSTLRAALLKRMVEEALTFKGLLKLGKTSNKEISCHMREAGENRNSKLQLCWVS